MKKKYKVILIIILSLISLICLIGVGNVIYKYYYKDNNAEVINDNGLSINYLSGMNYEFKNKEKHIKFSIINKGEEDILYHVSLMNFKCDGNTSYTLKEDGKIIENNKKLVTNSDISVSDFSQILIGNSKSYELIIYNNSRGLVNFDLSVEKVSESDPNFIQNILNNNRINNETKTKVGLEISNTDEGIIMDIDDYGNTYYFRGNVENNHVIFADKKWRIVRINGDGTIKLVLDENIGNSLVYNSIPENGINEFKKIEKLAIYNNLKNWYDENIGNYDSYVANYKFCSDVDYEGENLNNYSRINIANNPTFNCLGNINILKIGLLTVDEVIYAGNTINEINPNNYLINEEIDSWWTLSASKFDSNGLSYYSIGKDGIVSSDSIGVNLKALRPVINLNKEINMIGDGTKENPYKIQ